ncbi:LysR family transcriptional regulator [Alisedimentitalea sp. MJ-SS2]|uniref:LysR family transcriptional regulator n=1 Tax=Aliisedimentitalea sp. MJ-SS2 TaxID=3049795 RepID=UPI002910D2AA|nr:LysR family transcriptional regulator [Alisedimentitalea sp. MJ-SS2]MDU8928465.1 LysR family transcriptional regulator [Alisedimentitalea sp. MJ-SS2]
MNWDAMDFDWNQLRGFLATAEEGSLSAAARVLGLTQPTLGRQVTALEEALGVALFERVGRGLVLTLSGRELLPHARAMGEAAARVSLAAAGQAQAIEGKITLTASDMFSAHFLPPVLSRLREVAPRLELEVVATNDIRDILRREADIAIRHLRPTEPDLIARLVREATAHFYASAGYIARNGLPRTKADLSRHDFIGMGDNAQYIAHLDAIGITVTDEQFRVSSANGNVAWEMACQGLGIIAMSDEVAGQTPDMERLLPEMEPITFPIWLVTHRELHSAARIRLVYDMLADMLSQKP